MPEKMRPTGLSVEMVNLAASVLTESFMNYPLYSYTMPDENKRKASLSALFRIFIRIGQRNGLVKLSPDGTGVAIWLKPGKTEISALDFIRAGGFSNLLQLGLPAILRFIQVGNHLSTVRKYFLDEHTWYLLCIGVKPGSQRKGTASALIRNTLDCLRNEGSSCYLETFKPVNQSIYEHLGYKTVHESAIHGTKLVNYALLFNPQ